MKEKKTEKTIIRLGVSPIESNKKIGPVRSHLFNYLFAKKEKLEGKEASIIFRVDDSNKEKHSPELSIEILKFFQETLGFEFDITPLNSHDKIGQSVYQSERQEVYAKYLEELFDKHIAFVDAESGLTLFDVEKFIEQYGDVLEIDDLLRGRLKLQLTNFLNRGQRYFPLVRSDKTILYNLATVVDDAEFGVTHVIRGQDKIALAEYQEMVRVALGLDSKKFLHTPMLLNKDGSLKGSPHLNELIKEGVAPQALVSYMISSGYGDPENIYPSMESFAKDFNYKEIHKNNGKFDRQKLDSINKKIITSLSPEMYLDSIFIFLQKNNRGDIFDTLSNDTELKEIVSSVRRKPAEVISLIERILKPKHNTYDPSLKEVLDKLFIFLTQNNYQLPTAKEISVDEASLNNALRWILTGDRSFPSIEKVVTYLETKGELKARIELAESFYKIN